MDQSGFFDIDERLARLSGLGDQLEAFSRAVDFELYRPELEKTLFDSDGSKGGRLPFDAVMMLKILVIQTINTLSDERTEYLINDRLSFMRFLGFGPSDRVQDAKYASDEGRRISVAARGNVRTWVSMKTRSTMPCWRYCGSRFMTSATPGRASTGQRQIGSTKKV